MDEADDQPVTSMLAYCCADAETAARARSDGIIYTDRPLYDRYEPARAACGDRLLVIDRFVAGDDVRGVAPPESLVNVDPYLEPFPVIAAGGFVTRRWTAGVEVLLIFRRGAWDLPKGKLDGRETVQECAVREVGEELGIDDVRIEQSLGQTIHGYPDGSEYAVKTTHWFEMRTSARRFYPQREEDIEKAEWFAWGVARRRLGFETLRRHMNRVEGLVVGDRR